MLRPLALGVATVAATAGIAFAAAPAFAATSDAPAPGTSACTNLVNNQSNVEAAQTNLQTATDKLNTDLRANPVNDATVAADRIALSQAQSNLNNIVTNVTASLCTGTTSSTSSTSSTATGNTNTGTTTSTDTPAPTRAPRTVPATVSETAIDNEIAALNCNSTNADLQAIDRKIADRQAAHLPVAAVVAHLNGKLNQLSCTGNSAVTPQAAAQTAKDCGCVNVAPAGAVVVEQQPAANGTVTSKTVIPTADNGSVATTSGSEIAATDVPQGSVQTGAV